MVRCCSGAARLTRARACGTSPAASWSPGSTRPRPPSAKSPRKPACDVRTTALLTVVMDTYHDQFYTLNVYYLAEIMGGDMCAADDLVELRWFTPANLPAEFAFAHSRRVVDAWIATLAT